VLGSCGAIYACKPKSGDRLGSYIAKGKLCLQKYLVNLFATLRQPIDLVIRYSIAVTINNTFGYD
jgi:hypothetical protein